MSPDPWGRKAAWNGVVEGHCPCASGLYPWPHLVPAQPFKTRAYGPHFTLGEGAEASGDQITCSKSCGCTCRNEALGPECVPLGPSLETCFEEDSSLLQVPTSLPAQQRSAHSPGLMYILIYVGLTKLAALPLPAVMAQEEIPSPGFRGDSLSNLPVGPVPPSPPQCGSGLE